MRHSNLSVKTQGLCKTLSIYVMRFRILRLILSKKTKPEAALGLLLKKRQFEIASIKNIYRTRNW